MVQFDWGEKIQAAVFKKWQATGGKDIKIAVLDTGVDLAHPSLKQLNLPGHKFNAASIGFDPTKPELHGNGDVADAYRKKGHGTQCVSVISSMASPLGELLGVAPQAAVFIFKVNTVDHKFFRVKDFLRGLEAATKLGVDIIVVSIVYQPGDFQSEGIPPAEIERVLGLVKQSGAVLISALPNMKDGESWLGIASNNFPSLRTESINIGVVSVSVLNARRQEIQAEPGVHFLVSNAMGQFCKLNGEYVQEPVSSSYASYLVAGIAALYLASLKKRLKSEYKALQQQDFIKGLGQRFVKLADAQIPDQETPVFIKKTNGNV